MPITTSELNKIIKELNSIKSTLPYNKDMVYISEVIRILKEYTKY